MASSAHHSPRRQGSPLTPSPSEQADKKLATGTCAKVGPRYQGHLAKGTSTSWRRLALLSSRSFDAPPRETVSCALASNRVMALIRSNELTSEQSESLWLVKPFFPREGIVLLYGKKGVGKSPLTWALAESVATGIPWLGVKPSVMGEVLYLELDTPRRVVEPRMSQAMTSRKVAIFFPETPIADPAGWKVMRDQTQNVDPVLVVVNTLRKSHSSTDIE